MVAKKNSKTKKKLTSSEIMERVIDVEELEKRKQTLIKEEAFSKDEEVVTIKEKRWWELPMKKRFLKLKNIKVSFMDNMKDGVKMYGLGLMILKNS